MKKLMIIVAAFILITGSYFYYIYRLQANLFVNSFLNEIESRNTQSSKLNDYLLTDFDITPLKSWETVNEELLEKNPSITDEESFKIWKDVYLSRCLDYIDIRIDYPFVSIMSKEQFVGTYKDFLFFDFKINKKEFSDKRVMVYGEVETKYRDSTLGNSMFGGKQKFTLLMKKGKLGWKITIFSLDI